MLTFFLLLVMAYLLGSISNAVIITKIAKLPDPRKSGSKNPGTTNVLRTAGKKWAVLVLIGDVLKGFIPVIVARNFGIEGFALACIALAAFLGHLYPIFLKFKGGKGVATAFGAILALSSSLGLMTLISFIIIVLLTQYVSLGSILAGGLAPLYAFSVTPKYTTPILVIAILLILRHRENIKKLTEGKENKIKIR